jgi:phosphoribosylaminoimidazolecarboxamide formyltransferase/IMP cyclohydrolase
MRSHAKVMGLQFKAGVKRPDKVNARVLYITDEWTTAERTAFDALLATPAPVLTAEDRSSHMATLRGVALSSDAFFPFRDNIDVAAKHGVTAIVQPGGSVADDAVIAACNEYGIAMCFSKLRLFHH